MENVQHASSYTHTQLSFYSSDMFRSHLSHKLKMFYRIMHVFPCVCVCLCLCVCFHRQHQQHNNYVVCLPGGRQALGHVVCWRPQLQAAIPQQHLHGTSVARGQHMRVRTQRETLDTIQSTRPNSTRTSTPWLHLRKTSVATKKAEGIIHEDSYSHKNDVIATKYSM